MKQAIAMTLATAAFAAVAACAAFTGKDTLSRDCAIRGALVTQSMFWAPELTEREQAMIASQIEATVDVCDVSYAGDRVAATITVQAANANVAALLAVAARRVADPENNGPTQ